MTAYNLEKSMQDLLASCCTTEQLEGFVQGKLEPVTHSYIKLHAEEHCDLCRARLAYVREKLAHAVTESPAPAIWTQIAAGVSRLVEPISLTVRELGLQIHSGLTPVAAAATLDTEGLSIGGHRPLPLRGDRVVDLEVSWSLGGVVSVRLSPRRAMRARVSLERKDGTCQAELLLRSTLEIELASGSWLIRVKSADDAEEREIPFEIDVDPKS